MSHAGIKGFWIYGLGKSWAFYGLYLCSVDVSVIFFFNCFGLTLVHYLSLSLFTQTYEKVWSGPRADPALS